MAQWRLNKIDRVWFMPGLHSFPEHGAASAPSGHSRPSPDYKIFPEHSKHRAFYDVYAKQFNINELSPILLVVTSDTSILSKKNGGSAISKFAILSIVPLIRKRIKEANSNFKCPVSF